MVLRSAWSRVPALALLLTFEVGLKPYGTTVAARQKPLTVEDIYGYEGWQRFNGSPEANMRWAPEAGPWLSDTHFLWPAAASGNAWLRVEALTGSSQPLFTTARLESALVKAGASPTGARDVARQRPSNFNSRRDALVLTIDTDLYLFDITNATATRLTSSPGKKSEVTFSPDGDSVAFIKDNNLYVTAVRRAGLAVQDPPHVLQEPPYIERALTTDGNAELLNGTLDWVYSEELYGRGTHRAYWWSPDSSSIAFIQLDETPVPEYALVDDLPYHPEIERLNYPKAGDPNPIARLGIVARSGGPPRWIDTSKYSDFLIVSVAWDPNGRAVVYQIQNRQQTWLDLNRADVASGAVKTLLRETSRTWVERWQDASADPVWLKDGSFLWLSERSGWRHLYHYSAGGSLIRQVTSGEWEVRRMHGLDPAQTAVFFDATARSPVGLDPFRINLDGTGLRRLSTQDGRHLPFLNPSRTLFLDSWSDVTTPPQVRLHQTATGETVRIVHANPVASLTEYRLSKPELLQVKTRDGFVMEAMMIKPSNFDPSKRYPVYQFTYAGPHSQQVLNAWTGSNIMYHQLLAQQGIIVWMVDNRTASGKGMQSAWPLYRSFGQTELRDIEDGISWLKKQAYVDGSRIGISGISFGGYITLYALTHSKSFTMGIAEGAVSDWRNYDTIYTERYMGLPDDNPEGYRQSSPRFSAANLSGELLLIHSMLDDNVHPQNATQFAYELQKAGKRFQMMMYPKAPHGVSEPQLALHMRQMMLEFTLKNLLR
ncbi:MAG TPA: DPP IV N-terminal domain-containing protein [Vicinamibacterales bacterium]|nr:DPP IV N-terminal domain-containing protein [Vicinamibacterales bacterium]